MPIPSTVTPSIITGGFRASTSDSNITSSIGAKRVRATANLSTGGNLSKEITIFVAPSIPQISATNAPLLDGNVSSIWTNTSFSQYTYALTNVLTGTKDASLSGSLKMAYDGDNIYGELTIVDDTWSGTASAGSVSNTADSVEIYFKGSGDASNQIRVFMNPTGLSTTTPVVGDSVFIQHRNTATATSTNFRRAIRQVNATTRVLEFAINRSLFGFASAFTTGQTIRVDVHYNDSDASGVRESKIAWLSIADDLTLTNTSTYPPVNLGNLVGNTTNPGGGGGSIPGVPTDVTYPKAPVLSGRNQGTLQSGGGGWFTHIISDPYSPATFYTGPDVGGFYWYDGTKWIDKSPLVDFTDGDKVGVESFAIAKPPTSGNPGVIYLMGGEIVGDARRNGFILRSTDKGDSWKRLGLSFTMHSNGTGRSRGEQIAVNPNDWRNIIVASRNGTVYITQNGGETAADWTVLNPATGNTSGLPSAPTSYSVSGNPPIIPCVAFDPLFPNRVYLAITDDGSANGGFTLAQSGIYASENAGLTWTKVGSNSSDAGLSKARRMKVAYNGSATIRGTLWVTHSNGVSKYVPNNNVSGIWTTTTSATLNTISSLSSNNEFRALGLRRDAPDEVLIANTSSSNNTKVFRTTNGGTNWTSVAYSISTDITFQNALNSDKSWHADQISDFTYDLYSYPSGNSAYRNVWFSNFYAAFRCVDISTPTFETKALGLNNLVVLTLCTPPGGSSYAEVLYGAADSTGFAHDTAFTTYPSKSIETDFANGVGGLSINDRPQHIRGIDYCQTSPSNIVAVGVTGSNHSTGTSYRVDAIKSADGGQTWTKLNLDTTLFSATETAGTNHAVSVAVSAVNPNIIVISRNSGAPAITTDGGTTWNLTTGAGGDTAAHIFYNQRNLCADRVNGNKFYYRVNNNCYRGVVSGGNIAWELMTSAIGLSDYNSGDATRLDDNNTLFGISAGLGVEDDVWLYHYKHYSATSSVISTPGALKHSVNGGATWSNVAGFDYVVLAALGAPDSSVPGSPYTVYVYGGYTPAGTTTVRWGLRYSTNAYNNNNPTWVEIPTYSYAAVNKPQAMAASKKTFGSVFVGTNGSGVYYNALVQTSAGIAVAVTAPTAVSTLYAGVNTITAVASKPAGNPATYSFVEFYVDGNRVGVDTTATNGNTFSINTELLGGYREIKAVLSTSAGTVESQVVNVFVRPVIPYNPTGVNVGNPPDSSWATIKPVAFNTLILPTNASASDNNISGFWKARYDENNLYLYLRVFDDVLRKVSASGSTSSNDDQIELYVSPTRNTTTAYVVSDRAYRIDVVGASSDSSVIFSYTPTSGTGAKVGTPHEVKRHDSRDAAGNYLGSYEMLVKIPLNYLGFTPTTSDTDFGFEIALNDNDTSATRERKLAWYGTADNFFNNPSNWGAIRIAGRSAAPAAEVVTITTPNSGSDYQRDTQVSIVATATTNAKTLSKVELLVDNILISEQTGQSPFTFTYTPLTVGNKNVVVRGSYIDRTTVSSNVVSLNIVEPNTVTIVSPTQNQQVVLGSSIVIIASENSPLGNVTDVTFFYGLEGEDLSYFDPPQTTTDSQGRYVQPWTPSSAGIYNVKALANYDDESSALSPSVRVAVVNTPTPGGGSNTGGGTTTPVSGKFTVIGNKIIGPNGTQFVAKGIHYPANPSRPLSQDLDMIEKSWGFNCVILDCNLPLSNSISSIIDALTARKIVTIISITNLTGNYITDTSTPSLMEVSDFLSDLALTYRSNPYVWFNLHSQPGANGAANVQWRDSHQALILAIRETGGSDNIIVCSGGASGQDLGASGLATHSTANSAILAYGDALKSFNSKTFSNITYGIHIQDQWLTNTEAKLKGYVDAVGNSGKALVVLSLLTNVGGNSIADVVNPSLLALNNKLTGRVSGYWFADGNNFLTEPSGSNTNGAGYQINRRFGKPTNLTAYGDAVYNDTKAILTPPSTEPIPGGATGSAELVLTKYDIVEDIFALNQQVKIELEITNVGTASSALQTLVYVVYINGSVATSVQSVVSVPPAGSVTLTTPTFTLTRAIRSLRIERQV